jgi:hypothetical protein
MRVTYIAAGLLIGVWFLNQLVHAGAVAQVQTGGVAYLHTLAASSSELLPHVCSTIRVESPGKKARIDFCPNRFHAIDHAGHEHVLRVIFIRTQQFSSPSIPLEPKLLGASKI